jgi:hypothetical protein
MIAIRVYKAQGALDTDETGDRSSVEYHTYVHVSKLNLKKGWIATCFRYYSETLKVLTLPMTYEAMTYDE